ncbi:MAG: hypothetical protein AB7D27_02935 [Desulfomicrobium sp.]
MHQPPKQNKRNKSSFTPKDDVLKSMLAFAASMGLEITDPATGGKLTRCPVAGKSGKRDGAYIIHLDEPPSIWCQNYVTGETNTWAATDRATMTDQQRATLQARIERDKLAREEEQTKRREQAASKAQTLYQAAAKDLSGHPYLVKKKLRFPDMVRRGRWPQRGWPDALLIPMYNEDGEIKTLQAINGDGSKDLLAGGQKRGCFCPLGKIRGSGRVLIGEGLATVAAGCLAMDCPGVMAIDAGNLLAVGQVVRSLAGPDVDIIFLADDDKGGARA